jgi:DNA anti-recombination protein RmuC
MIGRSRARWQSLQREYDQAFNKLTGGRGNLTRQAENLKALGVKPTKGLPSDLVGIAAEELTTSELFDENLAVSPKETP